MKLQTGSPEQATPTPANPFAQRIVDYLNDVMYMCGSRDQDEKFPSSVTESVKTNEQIQKRKKCV